MVSVAGLRAGPVVWALAGGDGSAPGSASVGREAAVTAGQANGIGSVGLAAGGPVARPVEAMPAGLAWVVALLAVAVIVWVGWALWRSPSPFETRREDPPARHRVRGRRWDDPDWGSVPPDVTDRWAQGRNSQLEGGLGGHAHGNEASRESWVRQRSRPSSPGSTDRATTGGPGGAQAQPAAPIGPDDDEVFLRELDARIRLERERRAGEHPDT